MNNPLKYGGDANLSHINPGYPKNPIISHRNGATINCVCCAIATDIYNATDIYDIGIKFTAPEVKSRLPPDLIAQVYGEEFKPVTSFNEIREKLSEPESRGIVLIQSYDRADYGTFDHVFNVMNKNGEVVFMDGQNNRIVENIEERDSLTTEIFLLTIKLVKIY